MVDLVIGRDRFFCRGEFRYGFGVQIAAESGEIRASAHYPDAMTRFENMCRGVQGHSDFLRLSCFQPISCSAFFASAAQQ